ncbi:hypothetical protein [Rhizobium leguminosarum]|uniref:hypothetical protein n=1 Tax=Rhizobium leguminosarum TaxID=384 RepID=UPI001C98B62C|nr:hypothetical protein [Rhizobium leguminosarum]MBY5827288.1 hypothetical protein [Rhizobium leguminosarum]
MAKSTSNINLWKMLADHKYLVLDKLGATFERDDHFFYEELEVDFTFVHYAGVHEVNYPVLQTLNLRDRFMLIHDAELLDYGYYVEDQTAENDYPKSTSGPGDGGPGRLQLKLEHIDRLGCRLTLRGHLHGNSFDMNTEIRLRFRIRGAVVPEWLGYVGEALSEGYVYCFEQRYKQELFQYFAALDSFIEMHVGLHNAANPNDPIEIRQLLADKFKLLVKHRLKGHGLGLNNLSFWGDFCANFEDVTKLRNAIAHNSSSALIGEQEANDCFAVVAAAIALVEMSCLTANDILAFYNISLP